jgi:prepilin-type N-terminal cleavage/methylation domain-containing protein
MKKGFTLIETLIVVAILGILILMVIVAVNPAKRFNWGNGESEQQQEKVEEPPVFETGGNLNKKQVFKFEDEGNTCYVAIYSGNGIAINCIRVTNEGR